MVEQKNRRVWREKRTSTGELRPLPSQSRK
jgi:hypothetical protein